MKKIIYTRPDGGLSVVHPAEGARLASAVMDASGGVVIAESPMPIQVDRLLRRWPVPGVSAVWAETEDEFVERIRVKDVPVLLVGAPPGANPLMEREFAILIGAQFTEIDSTIVPESAIPTDRYFRGAWVRSGSSVTCHLPTAREIKRQHLRAQRVAQLADADVAFYKALESYLAAQPNLPAPLVAAINRKKALRDVTADPRIDAVATVEELKSVIPDALL